MKNYFTYDKKIQTALQDNIWTEISEHPKKWIVADTKKNVIYKASIQTTEHKEKGQVTTVDNSFSIGSTLIRCISIDIIKHESPLEHNFNFLNPIQGDYTITFKDTTYKEFTLSRKTKEQIVEHLKNEGYVMPGYGAAESLNAIISAFREDGKLKIDKSINVMGIFYIDGKLVPVKIQDYMLAVLDGQIDVNQYIDEIKQTAKFIDELVKRFRHGVVSAALIYTRVTFFGNVRNQIVFPSTYAISLPNFEGYQIEE